MGWQGKIILLLFWYIQQFCLRIDRVQRHALRRSDIELGMVFSYDVRGIVFLEKTFEKRCAGNHQTQIELEMPFAELDELTSRIDLELVMDNKVLQGRLYSISQSRVLIDRMNEAVSVLKKKPKDGPLLYDVIYKTYMSRSIPENIFDLLYNLHMSRRRYYELRKRAIRIS